jgi:hypothetical protein
MPGVSRPDPESTRGVILVKGCFGLLGRLKAVIESLAYAELTNRDVFVEWRDEFYSPDGDDVFFKLFESRVIRPWPDSPPSKGTVPVCWAPFIDVSVHELETKLKVRKDARGLEDFELDVTKYEGRDPIIVVFKGARNKHEMMERLRRLQSRALDPRSPVTPRVIRPSIERQDFPELIKEVMSADIVPRPEIRQQVDAFKNEHFAGCVIGVHVRYTDKMVNLSAVHSALRGVLETEPGAKIFLATDSQLAADHFKKRYPNVIVRDIKRSSGVAGLHVPSSQGVEKLQNAVDALIDIYLLAACDYLLYCPDMGFAILPYALSDIDESRKIAYQRADDRVLADRPAWAPRLSVLVPFRRRDELARCLRQLSRLRYPQGAYRVTVFGDFRRSDAWFLRMRFPGVARMRGLSLAAAVRSCRGQAVAITDARCDHPENWIAEGMDRLVGTPLAGLVYGAAMGDNGPRQMFLWRALIKDPDLDMPDAELAPESAWGRRATALGYKHRPLEDA